MPFAEVFGHHRLINLLKRSIAGGTLPPSLLFVGPAGVGKRTVAICVAQALNCVAGSTPPAEIPANPESRIPNPPAGEACGTCVACRRIGRGVHPDVLV